MTTTDTVSTNWGPLPTGVCRGSQYRIPEDLMPHQREGVAQFLYSDRKVMNLGEMGTGKTPFAIAVAEIGHFQNVLVLVPKPIRLEWEVQIKEWTPSDVVVCRRGSGRRLDPFFKALEEGRKPKYFILNYDTFRLDRLKEIVELYPWDLVIMDEGHQIRNDRTTTTRGLIEFLSKSKARVLPMTGSPIVNSGLDIYTLLMCTDPNSYTVKNRHVFLDEYFYWTTGRQRPKIFSLKRERAYQEFMSGRLIQWKKEEVLKDLPEKYYRRVVLDMEDDQRDIYDNMLENLVLELESEDYFAGSVLAQLTRLRQLNLDPRILGIEGKSSSKTEFILEMVEEGAPEKLVIFSTFDQYIRLLEQDLEKRGIEYVSITGRTNSDMIVPLAHKFQEDPRVKVAIGTHKVMGQGITLHAARDVILADRWWTPAANNQAVDRLHRKGQKNAVQVITLTNEDSVDGVLDEVISRKMAEADIMLSENTIIEETLDDLRQSFWSRKARKDKGDRE